MDRQHVRNYIGDLAEEIDEVGAEVRVSEGGGGSGFAVWRDGQKVTYDAAPDLIKALDGLTPRESGLLVSLLRAPARILRAGATLTPSFIARNPIRDQMSAAVYSRNGYIPVWDAGKTFEKRK